MHEQPDTNEAKLFWSKISEGKEQNRKAEWINMEKELQGLRERPKAIIHPELLRATRKKYRIGKRQAIMAY